MIAPVTHHYRGTDEARPRCGGDVASIIRASALEIGPFTARVVMTESRRTIVGGSMPVCWAIITRLYENDADGPEVLVDRESVWTDAAVLDGAYDDALRESALLVQGALTEKTEMTDWERFYHSLATKIAQGDSEIEWVETAQRNRKEVAK